MTQPTVPDTLPGFPGAPALKAAIEEIGEWSKWLREVRKDDKTARVVAVCEGSLRVNFEALAVAEYVSEKGDA